MIMHTVDNDSTSNKYLLFTHEQLGMKKFDKFMFNAVVGYAPLAIKHIIQKQMYLCSTRLQGDTEKYTITCEIILEYWMILSCYQNQSKM